MICTFEIVSHLCITIGKCSQPVKRSTQTLATYQHHLSHNLYGLTSSTSPGQPSHPRSLYAANSACTGRKQTASHTAHDVGVFHNTCLRALEDSSATRCTHHGCTLYLSKHASHPLPLEHAPSSWHCHRPQMEGIADRDQVTAGPRTSDPPQVARCPGYRTYRTFTRHAQEAYSTSRQNLPSFPCILRCQHHAASQHAQPDRHARCQDHPARRAATPAQDAARAGLPPVSSSRYAGHRTSPPAAARLQPDGQACMLQRVSRAVCALRCCAVRPTPR